MKTDWLLGMGLAFTQGCAPQGRAPVTHAPRPAAAVDPTSHGERDRSSLGRNAAVDRAGMAFRRHANELEHDQETYSSVVATSGAITVVPNDLRSVALGTSHPRGARTASPNTGCTFETVAIGANRQAVTAPTLEPTGEASVPRTEAREVLQNESSGVEQSWTFDHAPGRAPLEVRVHVAGCAFVASNDSGLHFRDRATGLGVKYSHASWVDAHGTRTAVRARYSKGDIVLTVPDRILAGSAYPAVLDPSISPEYLVDSPIVLLPDDSPSGAVVAAGSGQYLVAWSGQRGVASRNQIIATRIDDSGKVLDPSGIIISEGDAVPAVAWNGEVYLVVWASGETDDGWTEVDGARIASTGEVLDAVPLVIASEVDVGLGVTVGSDGDGFLVVWGANDAGNVGCCDETRARVLTGAGPGSSPQMSAPVTIQPPPLSLNAPQIAFNGTNYVVVSTLLSGGTVSAISISPAGAFVGSTQVQLPTLSCAGGGSGITWANPTVAVHGSELFMLADGPRVESTTKNLCQPALYGVRLGANLQPTDVPFLIEDSANTPAIVAFNGTSYQVAFSIGAGPSLLFQVDVTNDVVGPSQPLDDASNTAYGAGSLACDGVGCLVTVGAKGAFRLAQDETLLDSAPIPLSTPATSEQKPAAAFGAGEYLVAWQDFAGPFAAIHAARADTTGTSLDPTPIVVNETPNVTDLLRGVAFDGTDFVVLWGPNSALRASRITPAGVLLDPDGIVITDTTVYGFISCGTSNCLSAWTAADGSGIYASRLSADGVLLDSPPIQLEPGPPGLELEGLGFNGANYLITFHGAGSVGVFASRVTQAGQVLDSPPITLPLTTVSQIAAQGSEFLVAGQVDSLATFAAVRVDGSGALLGSSFPLTSTFVGADPSPIDLPVVVGIGGGFAVAWSEKFNSSGDARTDIYGNFVAADGTLAFASGIPLVTTSFEKSAPALAAGPDNALLAYQHLRADEPYGSLRIEVRIIDPNGTGLGESGGAAGAAGDGGEVSGGGGSGGTSTGSAGTGTGSAVAGTSGIGGSGDVSGGASTSGGSLGVSGTSATGGLEQIAGFPGAGSQQSAGTSGSPPGTSGGGGCSITTRTSNGAVGGALSLLLLLGAARRRRARVGLRRSAPPFSR